METRSILVRVPATSANLGPGFDCLGLALDLWNETSFTLCGEGVQVEVEGLGAGWLPIGSENLIASQALAAMAACGAPAPKGLSIRCHNHIPPASGLGSSAAAILTGVLGGNALAGGPLSQAEILELAVQAEGHPDNAAAALLGGLVISARMENGVVARRVETVPLWAAVVTPDFHITTQQARAALAKLVPLADAVFNLGRTALTVEALRSGDLRLLGQAMQDRLHQPYRLKLIPGGERAYQAAIESGAAAVALSGAGPSLIAFSLSGVEPAARAMAAAFAAAGLAAQTHILRISEQGAQVLNGDPTRG